MKTQSIQQIIRHLNREDRRAKFARWEKNLEFLFFCLCGVAAFLACFWFYLAL